MTFNTIINFFYNELPIVKIRIGDKTEKYNYKEPEVRAKKQSGNKSRSNVDRFLNSR